MAETYVARSSAIAARMLGGEMMIMSAVNSTFFTLNEVATVIWQAADGRTPLSEIVRNTFAMSLKLILRQRTEMVSGSLRSSPVTAYCWFRKSHFHHHTRFQKGHDDASEPDSRAMAAPRPE